MPSNSCVRALFSVYLPPFWSVFQQVNPYFFFFFHILHTQDKQITGQEGLLTLKSVKRTDSGEYSCHATDYENLDADLRDTLTLTVNCE